MQEEQLQSSEREKETVQQQLTRKEAELTRAEDTIRKEQHKRVSVNVCVLLLLCVCVCVCVCVL